MPVAHPTGTRGGAARGYPACSRVIDGTPALRHFSIDREQHRIEMPCIAWLSAPSTEVIGVLVAKGQPPRPLRFGTHHCSALHCLCSASPMHLRACRAPASDGHKAEWVITTR